MRSIVQWMALLLVGCVYAAHAGVTSEQQRADHTGAPAPSLRSTQTRKAVVSSWHVSTGAASLAAAVA